MLMYFLDNEGNPRGSAFVTLGHKDDVDRALRLSGSKIDGRAVKISTPPQRR